MAGEVVAVGTDVEGYAVGDAVFGTGLSKDHYGACAERVAVPTDRLAHVPDGVDPVAAGAVGVVGVTAWRALIDHPGLRPAESVLVHGGSGGVGHVAVQVAAAAGARVVTTAAPASHDRLDALGADVVLDYARDDLADPAVGFTSDGVARSKDLQYRFMSMFNTPELAVPLERIARLLADGALDVAVARTYDLDGVEEAHRAVLADSFVGKLVVVP